MKPSMFTDRELQQMRFTYPDLEELARFFEGSFPNIKRTLRERTAPPVNFIKAASYGYLLNELVHLGYTSMAQHYGVSTPFLKNQIQTHHKALKEQDDSNAAYMTLQSVFRGEDDQPPVWDRETLIERIPYSTMLRKAFNIFAKGRQVDFSGLESAIGRWGENFFADNCGEDIEIVVDMNEVDPRSAYDFLIKLRGEEIAINVKFSKPVPNTKGVSYKFTTKGEQDFFACICGDTRLKKVYMMYLVPADKINAEVGNFYLREWEELPEGTELIWHDGQTELL